MKYPTRILAYTLLFVSPAISLADKKSVPHPQASPTAISSEATTFLDSALDIMRQHALHSQGVDWAAVRLEAFKRAGGAFNPIDTYPAIYWALVQLGDSGSHLRLPPGLYPDQIALMQQAEKEAMNTAPASMRSTTVPTAFSGRRLPEGHIVTIQGNNYGYVVLPRCSAKDNDGLTLYAADVRRILTELSSQHAKGWIVDLRGNTGGNMWPMLTGIGPILGEGAVGSFVAADGNKTWFYKDGKTGTRNAEGIETVSLTLDNAPELMAPAAPVAVLVDSSTASSAEAITIAFHGRTNTRFFGSKTAGKSTAVQPFQLEDGAEIYLTTAIDADRNGKAFPDGITPDELFPSVASLPAEGNDPVVHAAETWLGGNGTPGPVMPMPPSKHSSRHKSSAATLRAEVATPAPASAAPVAVVAPAPVAVVAPAPVAVVAPAPVAAVAPAPVAAVPPAHVSAPAQAAPATASKPLRGAAAEGSATTPVPVKRKRPVVHQGS